MKTETDHPVIGRVTVVRSRRARRISISVRTQERVRLSVPWGVSVGEAMRFLDSKSGWVEEAKRKVAARSKPEPPVEMPYRTRNHELILDPSPSELIKIKVGGGEIRITYPLEKPVASEEIQRAIRIGIEGAWRAEAREVLPRRTEELAREHGFRFRSVTLRNTRSRWGSCSAKDDISLSIRLMKLPDDLADYIILHELCHTVHKNHGPGFHELLDKVTGGQHAAMRKRLRSFR